MDSTKVRFCPGCGSGSAVIMELPPASFGCNPRVSVVQCRPCRTKFFVIEEERRMVYAKAKAQKKKS